MQHSTSTADEARDLADKMRNGCVGVRIGRLHRLVSREFERVLRPTGLSLPQMEVLSALTLWGGPARPTELADILSIERSTMSRNLALMQTRGLVEVTDTTAAGRTREVTITTTGTQALCDADDAWEQAQATVLRLIGTDTPQAIEGWVRNLSAGLAPDSPRPR